MSNIASIFEMPDFFIPVDVPFLFIAPEEILLNRAEIAPERLLVDMSVV